METALTDIYLTPDLGKTPARVNRRTGELYLNGRTWNSIPPDRRLFILLHEAGHATLKTRDEVEADNFAFDAYADLGHPLSESVKSLSRVLHFENPGHYDRVAQQLKRAVKYDYFVNGNRNINIEKMNDILAKVYNNGFDNGFSDFTPEIMMKLLPKKLQKKIEEKLKAKYGAQSSKEAATKAGQATNQTAPAAAPAAAQQQQAPDTLSQPAKKGLSSSILIGGAVLIVGIVLAFILIKRKK